MSQLGLYGDMDPRLNACPLPLTFAHREHLKRLSSFGLACKQGLSVA